MKKYNFKRKLSLAVAVVLFVTMIPFSSVTAVNKGKIKTYIVITNTDKSYKKVKQNFGTNLISENELLEENNVLVAEMSGLDAELLNKEDGVSVEEDIVLEGSQNDKFEADFNQWNLEAIGLNNIETYNNQVKIEVLDSGSSYTDDIDIEQRVNLIPGEEEVSPMWEDANGHGTGICGMIAAKDNGEGITGVNPNAKIYSVKALDENIQSPLSRIIEGIYWGIENDMDIINMSFGTTVNSEILHQAIKDANDAGILLIGASGNETHKDVQYPAAYNEVIAVGSTTPDGKIAEHTSTGTQLELLAPGEQVATTGLFYGVMGVSGTSLATAQITGIASLLMARDNTKSADFIKSLMKASAKSVEESNAGLVDYEYATQIYDEYAEIYLEGENIDAFDNTGLVENYTDEAQGVVEGLWSDSKHNDVITYAISNANNMNYIETRYMQYVGNACYRCDRAKENYPQINDGLGVNCLHATRNYVATLKFLWKFAEVISVDTGNSLNSQLSSARSKALAQFSSSNLIGSSTDVKNDYTYLLDLATYTVEEVKYFNPIEATARKYVVIGIIMHFLGDFTAHRTKVPQSMFDNAATNPTNQSYFNKADFTTTKWNEMISRYNTITYFDFTLIQQYATAGTGSLSRYEDNPSCIPNRFEQSKFMAFYFLAAFNADTGFSLNIFNPQYSDLTFVLYDSYVSKASR